MRSVRKAEALALYAGNGYKTELIENLEDGSITFCDHSDFWVCAGRTLTEYVIKAIKVMNVAGAYWRGDENKPQLTRVYGTSFPKGAAR